MPDTNQTEDWTEVWGSVVQEKYSLNENNVFFPLFLWFWLLRRAMMEVLSGSYSCLLTGAFCNLLLACLRYLNVLHLILPLGKQSALYKSCSAFSATLEPPTAARVTIPPFPFLFFWTVARILKDTKAPDCIGVLCSSTSVNQSLKFLGKDLEVVWHRLQAINFMFTRLGFKEKKRCRIGLENRAA